MSPAEQQQQQQQQLCDVREVKNAVEKKKKSSLATIRIQQLTQEF